MLPQLPCALGFLLLTAAHHTDPHMTERAWQNIRQKMHSACTQVTTYGKNKYAELKKRAAHSALRPYSYALTNDTIDQISSTIDSAKTEADCQRIIGSLKECDQSYARRIPAKKTLLGLFPKLALLTAATVADVRHGSIPPLFGISFAGMLHCLLQFGLVDPIASKQKRNATDIAKRAQAACAKAKAKQAKIKNFWW